MERNEIDFDKIHVVCANMKFEDHTNAAIIDFHVHSKYSLDSILDPRKIIKVARRKGLNGIAVTDHDTIKGGLEAFEIAKSEKDFVVIIGAEIRTNIGDVIGLFLSQEIQSREFSKVINEIKKQGGLVILPHPYRTFAGMIPSQVVTAVDIIESFNARVKNNSLNLKAQELAMKFRKPMVGGSDAHFAHEIGNGRTILANTPLQPDAIKKALLEGKAKIEGKILPFFLYASYEFGIGKALRFIKKHHYMTVR